MTALNRARWHLNKSIYNHRKTKIKAKERKEIFEVWAAGGNFRREKRYRESKRV